MKIESAKDLIVYQKAYSLAMEIFHVTKRFPRMLWSVLSNPSPFLLKEP